MFIRDEAAGREFLDLLLIDGRLCGEIIPGEFAHHGKAREPERHVDAPRIFARDFTFAQVRDGLDEGELPSCRLRADFA